MENSEIDQLAKIIWDYHRLNHQLKKVDCLLVLGSQDIRVAQWAADLFLKGYAPFIIFSGGLGTFTKDIFHQSEAEIFADIAIKNGISPEKIIIENQSTNTGENIEFTKKLLLEKELNFNSFILITKPYMERRAFATFKKVWPEKNCTVSSSPVLFENYPNSNIFKNQVINIMVGDLQRIKIYPQKGFQIYQDIPEEVLQAFEKLVNLGYTKHLLKN